MKTILRLLGVLLIVWLVFFVDWSHFPGVNPDPAPETPGGPPPSIGRGWVIKVDPDPNNQYREIVTVKWDDNSPNSVVYPAKGACVINAEYPACADK
jgi:hypothetical protein